MVMNVGALKSGDQDAVKADIAAVVKASHAAGAIVKVILETALLDDNQKTIACALAQAAGADFVKTSTGFGTSGATAHDIALMRQAVGPEMGVKAAGGIRTLQDLRSYDRRRRHAHRSQRQRQDCRGHRCLIRTRQRQAGP